MKRKFLTRRKSHRFTEEQIKTRSYEIWENRGKKGEPEANRQAAIESLEQEQRKDVRNFTLEVVKVSISAFGVLATIFAGVGLYLTYQNSQAERQLNTDRLVTDRFAKAVEQLGSNNIHIRLGAIYSLERIAKDSPRDHWTVMEVLTAYVRNKSPLPKGWLDTSVEKRKPLPEVETDVQSALTVIGRRERKNDPEDKRLDLTNSNLRNANLYGAWLERANLERANLDGAWLKGANLDDAWLDGANLDGAWLDGANLERANLDDTWLKGAKITSDQIKQAYNWKQAHYSPYFGEQLGLPPEK
jgi:hypothetical protein